MTESTTTITGERPNEFANRIAQTIEIGVGSGLELDEAVCIAIGVAADYARAEYGDRYLEALVDVLRRRAGQPLPQRVN